MLSTAGHGLRSSLWQGTILRLSPLAKHPSAWPGWWCSKRAFIAGPARAEHVSLPCKSSGNITVSLYNVRDHPPTTPLLLYLPPFPQPTVSPAGQVGAAAEEGSEVSDWTPPPPPPSFLLGQSFPVAAIHYRWQPPLANDSRDLGTLRWPIPLHDVLFAYDWIKTHLAPPLSSSQAVAGHRHHKRRDFYAFGSYLGAGLATSLALTESHQHERLAVRGVAAYNGIYNWTAFVGKNDNIVESAAAAMQLPPISGLFPAPADLFDAFASPTLMFRTAGHLLPPPDFKGGLSDDRTSLGTSSIQTIIATRKAYLGFPPLRSTLVIPPALFLHKSPPPPPPPPPGAKPRKPRQPKEPLKVKSRAEMIPDATSENNSYAIQAQELSMLMRRSIKVSTARDLRSIMQEDGFSITDATAGTDQQNFGAETRVRTFDVGGCKDEIDFELGPSGQDVLLDWLGEMMNRRDVR